MNTQKWTGDVAHSEIQFKVKHLMISNVTGKFKDFSIHVESTADDFQNAKISFSAKTASVDTGSEQRDQHLVSADFFESDKYPEISFVSTSFKQVDGEDYKLKGDLTIKDVTKPVVLDVEFAGKAVDPWGNEKAVFAITGKINRKEWGLNWNAALETGGVLVSEEVKLAIEVQLAATPVEAEA